MHKTIFKIALVATLITPIAIDAEAPSENTIKVDTTTLEAAKECLASMKIQESYETIVTQATKAFIARKPTLKSVETDISKFYKKYIGWDAIKDKMAAIYARHYTVKELNELRDFYKTDVGQKSIKLLPQIRKEGQMLGRESVIAHYEELQKIIKKALVDKLNKEHNATMK